MYNAPIKSCLFHSLGPQGCFVTPGLVLLTKCLEKSRSQRRNGVMINGKVRVSRYFRVCFVIHVANNNPRCKQ
jgi:hypothetical protein